MSMPNQGLWRAKVTAVTGATVSIEIPRLNPGYSYTDVPIVEGNWTAGETTAITDALEGNHLESDGEHVHTFTTDPAGAQPDHIHNDTATSVSTSSSASTSTVSPSGTFTVGTTTTTSTGTTTTVHETPAGGESDHVHTGTTASAGGHDHDGSTLPHAHLFPNPLAVGDPIIVGFLEGNADLPVCLGRLSA